jgi:phosphatidate cytidylyltransferase
VVVLLGVAAAVAAVLPILKPGKSYEELRLRIGSWWGMVALLAGALLAGWQATVAVFALISFRACASSCPWPPAGARTGSRSWRPIWC